MPYNPLAQAELDQQRAEQNSATPNTSPEAQQAAAEHTVRLQQSYQSSPSHQASLAHAAQREAEKAQQTALEGHYRSQGIPTWTGADGNIYPDTKRLTDQAAKEQERVAKEQAAADKAAAAIAAKQQRAAAIRSERKHRINPVDGTPIYLESEQDLAKRRDTEAEKTRQSQLDAQIKAADAEHNDTFAKHAAEGIKPLTETARKRLAEKAIPQTKQEALAALQSHYQNLSAQKSGDADWIPFNESPTPEAQAAAEHLKRLQSPDADLTEEDLATLAGNDATKPLAARLQNQQQLLSKDDELQKLKADHALRVADLKLRRDAPDKWTESVRARRAAMSPEELKADLEASGADLDARAAALQQQATSLNEQVAQHTQQLDTLSQQAEQRRQQGIPAGDLVSYQGADGTVEHWPKDLAAQREVIVARLQDTQAQQQSDRAALKAQLQQYEQDATLHNEGSNLLKGTQAAQAQQQNQSDIDTLRFTPGHEQTAQEVAALDSEAANRMADLNTVWEGNPPPEAVKAIDQDIAQRRQAALGLGESRRLAGIAAADDLKRFSQYYDKDGFGYSQTEIDQRRAAIGKNLSQVLGITPEAADHLISDAQAQDWSPPQLPVSKGLLADTVEVGAKWLVDSVESIYKPAKEEEKTRLLSTGGIAVNPSITKEQDYRKAVEDSKATPEAKAEALSRYPAVREQAGQKVLDGIHEIGSIYGPDTIADYTSTLKNKPKDVSEAEWAMRFTENLKAEARHGILNTLKSVGWEAWQSFNEGFIDQRAMASGLSAGALPNGLGSETMMKDAQWANRKAAALDTGLEIGGDQSTNPIAAGLFHQAPRFIGSLIGPGIAAKGAGGALSIFAKSKLGTKLLPSVAALLAKTAAPARAAASVDRITKAMKAGKLTVAEADAHVAKSLLSASSIAAPTAAQTVQAVKALTRAGIGGAAAAGAAQTYGAQITDIYTALKAQHPEMSHADALRAAQVPSLLSAGVTAMLTVLVPGGSDRFLARPAVAKELFKKQFASQLQRLGYMGKEFLKGGGQEFIEEAPDELFSQYQAGVASNPDDPTAGTKAVAAYFDNLAALAVGVGVLGGVPGSITAHGTSSIQRPAGPTQTALLPETQAAADAAIQNHRHLDANNVEIPEFTQATQQRAALALATARGGDLFDATEKQLNAAGWTRRDSQGRDMPPGKFARLKDYTGPNVLNIDTEGRAHVDPAYFQSLKEQLPAVAAAIPDEATKPAPINEPTAVSTAAAKPGTTPAGQTPANGPGPNANPSPVQTPAQSGAEPPSSGTPPAQSGTPVATRSSKTGWEAHWELAQRAKQQGIDLSTLTREQFADFAIQEGLQIDDSQLRMATHLRNATSMAEYQSMRAKNKPTTPEQKQSDLDFGKFAQEQIALAEEKNAGTNSGEVMPGVHVRSGTRTSNSWLFWRINKGSSNTHQGSTHKAYLGFSNIYQSLTPARVKAFMAALQKAGYNGDIKTVQDLATQSAISDQIVMHGASEADAALALQVGKTFFDQELNFIDTGIDQDGKSHSQVLSDKIKQGIASGNPVNSGSPVNPVQKSSPTAVPTTEQSIADWLVDRHMPDAEAAAAAKAITSHPDMAGKDFDHFTRQITARDALLQSLGITGATSKKQAAANPLRFSSSTVPATSDSNSGPSENSDNSVNPVQTSGSGSDKPALPPSVQAALDDSIPGTPSQEVFDAIKKAVQAKELTEQDATTLVAQQSGAQDHTELRQSLENKLGWNTTRANTAAALHFGDKSKSDIPLAAAERDSASNRVPSGSAPSGNSDNSVNPVQTSGSVGPEPELAAAPSALTQNDDYARAKLAALSRIKDPTQKSWARQLFALIEKTFEKHHLLYDALATGAVARKHLGGQFTAVMVIDGKVTRLIDLDAMVGQFSHIENPAAALRATGIEEDVHALVLQLSRKNPEKYGYPALVKKWKALPDKLKQAVWQSYNNAAASIQQNTPLPANLSSKDEWHMMNEFLRMLVQDKHFAGQITETVDAAPGLIQWVKDLLKDLGNILRNLLKDAPPALQKDIKSMVAELGQRLKDIEKPSAATAATRLETIPTLADTQGVTQQALTTLLKDGQGILSPAALARIWDQLDPALQKRVFAQKERTARQTTLLKLPYTAATRAPKHELMQELLTLLLTDPAAAQSLLDTPKSTNLLAKLVSSLRSAIAPATAPSPEATTAALLGTLHAQTLRLLGSITGTRFVQSLPPAVAQAVTTAPPAVAAKIAASRIEPVPVSTAPVPASENSDNSVNPVQTSGTPASAPEPIHPRAADFLAAIEAAEKDHTDAANDEGQAKLRAKLRLQEVASIRAQFFLRDNAAREQHQATQAGRQDVEKATALQDLALGRIGARRPASAWRTLGLTERRRLALLGIGVDQHPHTETGGYPYSLSRIESAEARVEFSLAGTQENQMAQEELDWMREQPSEYQTALDPLSPAYVERDYVIIKQSALDDLSLSYPHTAALIRPEWHTRQSYGLRVDARSAQAKQALPPASPEERPTNTQQPELPTTAPSPASGNPVNSVNPVQTPSLVPAKPAKLPTFDVPVKGEGTITATFPDTASREAFQFKHDLARSRKLPSGSERTKLETALSALKARFMSDLGLGDDAVTTKLAAYHEHVVAAAAEHAAKNRIGGITAPQFEAFSGGRSAPSTKSLPAPVGGDLIADLARYGIGRISSTVQPGKAGDMDWFKSVTDGTAGPHKQTALILAVKAADAGELTTPLARRIWLAGTAGLGLTPAQARWERPGHVLAPNGMAIDAAASTLSSQQADGSGTPYQFESGDALGLAILDALDSRIAAKGQAADPTLSAESDAQEQSRNFATLISGNQGTGQSMTGAEIAAQLDPDSAAENTLKLGTAWFTVDSQDDTGLHLTASGPDADLYGQQTLAPDQSYPVTQINDRSLSDTAATRSNNAEQSAIGGATEAIRAANAAFVEGLKAEGLLPAAQRTPAFRQWFGNSKVTHPNGQPRIVYHGTRADFGEFTGSRLFFSNDASAAASYAILETDEADGSPVFDEQSVIMPAFLSLQNPLIVDAQGLPWHRVPLVIQQQIPGLEGAMTTADASVWDTIDGLSEHSKTSGFDGLIVRNVRDHNGYANHGTSTTYVAFHPEQIKSAFNRGTWNPKSPNILAASDRILKLAVDSATAYSTAGSADFQTYATRLAQDLPPAALRAGRNYIDAAWNIVARENSLPTIDPAAADRILDRLIGQPSPRKIDTRHGEPDPETLRRIQAVNEDDLTWSDPAPEPPPSTARTGKLYPPFNPDDVPAPTPAKSATAAAPAKPEGQLGFWNHSYVDYRAETPHAQEGSPMSRTVAKGIAPYLISGNKGDLVGLHGNFYLDLARDSNGVLDAFGGAAIYTHFLASQNALTPGSVWNEWEFSRATTNRQIRDNPAAVVREIIAMRNAYLQAFPPANIPTTYADMLKTREQILAWVNQQTERIITARSLDEMGRLPIPDTAEAAALYLFLQSHMTEGRVTDFDLNPAGLPRPHTSGKENGKDDFCFIAAYKVGTKKGEDEASDGSMPEETDAKPDPHDMTNKVIEWDQPWRIFSDKLPGLIRDTSRRLQQTTVRHGDGWQLAADAPADALVFVDTSYFPSDEQIAMKKKVMNYGKTTLGDGNPLQWFQKFRHYLLPKGDSVRYVITNNFNSQVVEMLEQAGWSVLQSYRGSPKTPSYEFIALSPAAAESIRLRKPATRRFYPGGIPRSSNPGFVPALNRGIESNQSGLPAGEPGQTGERDPESRLQGTAGPRGSSVRQSALERTLSGGPNWDATTSARVARELDEERDSNQEYQEALDASAPHIEDADLESELEEDFAEAARRFSPRESTDEDEDSGPLPAAQRVLPPKPDLDNYPTFKGTKEERRAQWDKWHRDVDTWRESVNQFADRQGNLGTFLAAETTNNRGGVYREARVITRIPGSPTDWRTTIFGQQRTTASSAPVGDWANNAWVPIAHDEFPTKGEAYQSAVAAMPESYTFSNKALFAAPRTVEHVEPGFYSALAEAIRAKMPARSTPATVVGILKNAGIKTEELKWTGILPWLHQQAQNGPITQQQVLDYLANEGAVHLQEVRLGETYKPNTQKEVNRLKAFNPDLARRTDEARSRDGTNEWHNFLNSLNEQDSNWVDRYIDAVSPDEEAALPTKYSQYQLPGGTNYREVVLTMPGKEDRTKIPEGYQLVEGTGLKKWEVYGPGTGRYAAGQTPSEAIENFWDLHGKHHDLHAYTSSHFQYIPNYVAHMRLNDRTDTEGKDGTFIEEIQSDRHQAGREKGYQISPEKIQRHKELREKWLTNSLTEQEGAEFDSLGDQYNQSAAVPDAPFRTSWPLQMFKRALVDAVASGKQWIGWTTGDTQAKRYDLSQQVSFIQTEHLEEAEGVHFVDIRMSKGNDVNLEVENGIVREGDAGTTGKPLSDVIGKEMAEKILSVPQGKQHRFSGVDLALGGEGMKGFYDTILPKEIGKYVKQWGEAVKEGSVQSVVKSSTPSSMDALLDELDDNGNIKPESYPPLKQTPIWRVDITPQMKAGVEAGQALFAAPRRAYESMTFDPPFHTRFGDILSYDWMNQPVGGLSSQRTSDWSRARTNPATGRDIVHHFKVQKPDGIHTVSLETALGQLTEPQRHKLQSLIKSEQRRREEAAAGQMTLFAGQRVTPEQDAEYMAAVESGDVAKQQAMVGAAAKAAGYDKLLHHGTPESTYTPGEWIGGDASNRSKLEEMASRFGINGFDAVASVLERWKEYGTLSKFGATDEDVANARTWQNQAKSGYQSRGTHTLNFNQFEMPSGEQELGTHLGTVKQALNFGEYAHPFFVKLGREVRLADLGTWDYQAAMMALRKKGVKISDAEYEAVYNANDNNQALRELLISKGVNSIVYKNEAEARGDSHIVFNPNQIKSADPITRDAEGNVIPLSQRFNPDSNSILFAAQRVEAAAAETDRNPSDAQKAAGNYPKGKVTLHGLRLSIENPRGSVRSGTDATGKPWSVTMPHHYGYFLGTEGKDGDHVDFFLGPNPDSQQVLIVNQRKIPSTLSTLQRVPASVSGSGNPVNSVNPVQNSGSGHFDEHKIMLGFDSPAQAAKAYLSAYTPGWKGLQSAIPTTIPVLKEWLENHDTTKPVTREGIAKIALSLPAAERVPQSSMDDSPQSALTLDQAHAAGFTMRVYRGISKAEPFNASGTVWVTDSQSVAKEYATEIMNYNDPDVAEILINPTGIPRHDMRKLGDEEREALDADAYGNPQKIGIYHNADDSLSGGRHTVSHVPVSAALVKKGALYHRIPGPSENPIQPPDFPQLPAAPRKPTLKDRAQVLDQRLATAPGAAKVANALDKTVTGLGQAANLIPKAVGKAIEGITGTGQYIPGNQAFATFGTTLGRADAAAAAKVGTTVADALQRVSGKDIRKAPDAVAAWLGKPDGLGAWTKSVVVDQLLPTALMPREWLALSHEMQRKTAFGAEKSNDLIRALSGNPRLSDLAYPEEFAKNPAYREQLFDAMENKIPMSSLPPAMQALGTKLRAMLRETGLELVKQGVMNPDTFEELQSNGWMPRYMLEEAMESGGSVLAAFKLGVKDLMQQRSTAFHIVDTTRKGKDGQYLTVNRKEGGRNAWRFRDAATRDAFYSDFIRRQALDMLQDTHGNTKELQTMMATLDGQQRREIRAQIKLLTRADMDSTQKLSPALAGMVKQAIEHQKSIYRKEAPFDPPKLIKDPVYSIARYILAQTHNAATMELLNETAKNKDWTSNVSLQGFTEIPDNDRFGPLAGKFVQKDIAQQILDKLDVPNAALRFYDAVLRKWKAGKLVWNPGSHIRDAVGNTVFAYLGGSNIANPGNWPYYRQAMEIMRNGGPLYNELLEHGVLGGDAYSSLVRERLKGLLPDAKTVENFNPGLIQRFFLDFGSKFHGTHEQLAEYRRMPDDFYKIAAYLKAKHDLQQQGTKNEELKTRAAEHVRKWFPYYDRLGGSATTRAAGRFVNPFLSFFRESTRILGTAAVERPIALAAALAFPAAISALSAMLLGLDDRDRDEISKDLAGRGKGILGLSDLHLFSMLLPVRSSQGQVQQFDISAVMPFADLLGQKIVPLEEKENAWQTFWRQTAAAGPIGNLGVSWITNRDLFSGRHLTEADMSTPEMLRAYTQHAAGVALPPLAPDLAALVGIGDGGALARSGQRQTNKTLQTYDTTQTVIRSIFGMNVKSAAPNIYRQADDFRKAHGYDAQPDFDYGTTATSRAKRALVQQLAQDQPNPSAIKNLVKRLKDMGVPLDTPGAITKVLKIIDPASIIGGSRKQNLTAEAARQRFRQSLPPESRALYEASLQEYRKIQQRAPLLLRAAQ